MIAKKPSYFFMFILLTVACSFLLFGEIEKPEKSSKVKLRLPVQNNSIKFAVIGDSGTGGKGQYKVADQMTEYHQSFPFEFVLMLGDNIYGSEERRDYQKKFERPYKFLLDLDVLFWASLGNHDEIGQLYYKRFNMGGRRYYSFHKNNAQFFALDTTRMNSEQLQWFENELRRSSAEWKVCFFHHPLYSSGKRHGSNHKLRKSLEPLFVKYNVNVVFSGHDHFYERIKPQKGILYFVSGAAAKVRHRNIESTTLTARGYAREEHFLLVEIVGKQLYFQTVSRRGSIIDNGVLLRQVRENTNP